MKHFNPGELSQPPDGEEPFEFDLWEPVLLAGSGELGVVIGRHDHGEREDAFLVRYVAHGGGLTEKWWHGTALEAVTIH